MAAATNHETPIVVVVAVVGFLAAAIILQDFQDCLFLDALNVQRDSRKP